MKTNGKETAFPIWYNAIFEPSKLKSLFSSSFNKTLLGKSWKTHPENFPKFEFSWLLARPYYWKTHPNFFRILSFLVSWAGSYCWKTNPYLDEFSSNCLWHAPEFVKHYSAKFLILDEFSSITAGIVPRNFKIDDWMSFPVKRGDLISYYPILKKNGKGTHKFSMDKFSSKTV